MKPLSERIRPEMFPYAVILTACFLLLLGAVVLSPPEAKSGHISLGRFPLPEVCIFNKITGLPCPGCGISRSMAAAMRGNFPLSWMHHRLGIATVLYIMLQFLLNLIICTAPQWKRHLQKTGRYLNRGLIFLGALFFFNWVINLVSLL